MLYERENHVFPMHMHRCYEFVLMISGEMSMQIEKEKYLLKEGDLVLIKPNRLHSYDTPRGANGKCLICVFSHDLIAAVSESLVRYKLASPIIQNLPRFYRDMFEGMNEDKDLATVKGFLYTVSGLFYQSLDFRTEDDVAKDTILLRDIFVYLENNISEACTLKGMAEALGYNPAYISRYFARIVGVPFYAYVQSVKMDRACYLLTNTKDSILSIAIQCGFTTLSSFNRTFKIVKGMTPREYRQALISPSKSE
jgi:AraC-like DNA-binding protein